MHNLYQADFRHILFILKTPQNIYPSWRKNRTESCFSKPNFDMLGPICCKSYNVKGDPQLLNFFLVQKNIYSQSPLCSRSLTSVPAEIWFFKSLDRGCRTKGPLPNLGRLTVLQQDREKIVQSLGTYGFIFSQTCSRIKKSTPVGLLYRPARLHYTGKWTGIIYDNSMPELILSPSHESMNSPTAIFYIQTFLPNYVRLY